MWVGPTQTRALDLIKEYGLHTIPQFETGRNIAELDGKRTTGNREWLGLDARTLAEYERVIKDLNHLTKQVPLNARGRCPRRRCLVWTHCDRTSLVKGRTRWQPD